MVIYMHGQRVCQIGTNFCQPFLFQAETLVRFVQGHAELMRSGGKRVLEMDRVACLEARRDDDAADGLAQLEARTLGISDRY